MGGGGGGAASGAYYSDQRLNDNHDVALAVYQTLYPMGMVAP